MSRTSIVDADGHITENRSQLVSHLPDMYRESGNILQGSFMNYLLPTAVETPNWETGNTVTPSPHHPLGAKGVGESATVGAPAAIVNAVVDALWHLGVRHIDIPITSAKVWKLLRDAGVKG